MLLESLETLPLPSKPAERMSLGSLIGSAASLTLSKIARRFPGIVMIVTPDSLSAARLERELKFFLKDQLPDPHNLNDSDSQNAIPVLVFPDWETLPYDTFSPHQDIISERLTTLYRLPDIKKGVLIVPVATLMHRVCPKEYLLQNTLWIKKGQTFSLELMRKRLSEGGYRCVSQVMEHGDFAIRGSIFDLFPMGSDVPFRIDLFGDEIDTIRTFDVETQRSLDKIDQVQLLPAREFPLTAEAISLFRTQFRDQFEGDPTQCPVYLDVSEGNLSPGLEYYLPLFFEKMSHLLEYLPEKSLVVYLENSEEAANSFWADVKERYDQYGHDRLRPILPPKALFLQPNEIFSEMKRFPKMQLSQKFVEEKLGSVNLPFQALPPLSIESRHEKPLARLADFLKIFKGNVLFSAESAGRREVLREWLYNIQCRPKEIENWSDYLQFIQLEQPEKLALIISPLEEGMIINTGDIRNIRDIQDAQDTLDIQEIQSGAFSSKSSFATQYAIITESELLGKRVMQRRLRSKRHPTFDAEVQSLAELTLGAPIVHIEHGIGRYQGLTHLTSSGQEAEYVTLEYAGGDKLYVPVTSLHLISRYSGTDVAEVALNRLGTDQWQKAKQKAIEQARDVAAELLEIYAHREAKKGFAFAKPDEHYESFSAEFPFEETPDQQRAIEQVLNDLTADKPMDRVVCGDVGFGKTEVALRASFLAVQSGRQVAVLVPTTLLAEQHYQTFVDRFSGFPVRVEVMSRFRTRKEQDAVCIGIEEGKIDILIGTHKILQDNIKFKNLGLLIIDEEHRFGVRQKETFKALRTEVDILTLTATPIPRTLNMAMAGMRDLSIIATPPARRLSIKTFVREKQSALIHEAILRELHRGGQVYYLHNAVETINREASELEKLVPNARIAVAHGQMRERELEQVMSDFYHRRYNVLVCTTIIETGIDIPTANTIIIDRADKFGLAQLHQLRGRVGRSHHQAYAFCLLPPKAKITGDAEKRLEALAAMEDLGAGFTLATQDLEIRGAGELLGEAQSGNIQSIGFHLYMEVLEQAVKTLQAGGDLSLAPTFKRGTEVDLQIPALIPEAYIPDVHTRLVLYKRIASSKNKQQLEDLMVEMTDRFGVLPLQTKNLFKIIELKLKAESLGICKIDANPKGGRLEFIAKPNVDPRKIIQLIQNKPNIYRLEGPEKLRFTLDLSDKNSRLQVVTQLVESLMS
jgi:transcription-repair coupling factor (superfamily II helicase)